MLEKGCISYNVASLPDFVHTVGSPASHGQSTASKGYIPPPSNAIHDIAHERWKETVLLTTVPPTLLLKTTQNAWNRPHPSRPVRKSNRCQGNILSVNCFVVFFFSPSFLPKWQLSTGNLPYKQSRSLGGHALLPCYTVIWGLDTPKLLFLSRN